MGGGFIACFAFGVLQVFIQGAVSWGWQSILLDYVLAFGVMGIAGLGRGKPHGIFWGSVLGGAARFVVHYISGITIYKILAPTEIFGTVFDNPALYSLIYNGSYVGIDLVLCLVNFWHPLCTAENVYDGGRSEKVRCESVGQIQRRAAGQRF